MRFKIFRTRFSVKKGDDHLSEDIRELIGASDSENVNEGLVGLDIDRIESFNDLGVPGYCRLIMHSGEEWPVKAEPRDLQTLLNASELL